MFIELTQIDGIKFIANPDHIKRAVPKEKNTYISGLNNNGGFEVLETYEQVCHLIALSKGSIIKLKY